LKNLSNHKFNQIIIDSITEYSTVGWIVREFGFMLDLQDFFRPDMIDQRAYVGYSNSRSGSYRQFFPKDVSDLSDFFFPGSFFQKLKPVDR